MQSYSNLYNFNDKCIFSPVLQQILFLFGFSHLGLVRASKFLHRISKFMNYANLCKSMQKNDTVLLYFPANLLHLFLFCLSDSVLVVVPSRPTQNSEIHYLFNLSNLPKTSMKSAASLFCSGFSFCLYYLIGFGCSFQISKKNSEFLFFLEGSEIVKLK